MIAAPRSERSILSTITSNAVMPMEVARAPNTPIIEKIKQEINMEIARSNGLDVTRPMTSATININASQTSMAFLRCNIGPALSGTLAHIAPIDTRIPAQLMKRIEHDRGQGDSDGNSDPFCEVV